MKQSIRFDRDDNRAYYIQFKLPTIKELHLYHDGILASEILNNMIDCMHIQSSFIHRNLTYSLRTTRKILKKTSIFNFHFYSTISRLIRLRNSLTFDLRNLPIGQFKHAPKSHFVIYTFQVYLIGQKILHGPGVLYSYCLIPLYITTLILHNKLCIIIHSYFTMLY